MGLLAGSRIPRIHLLLLAASLGLFAYGTAYLWTDLEGFRYWIREDGLVEWLTVVGFFACAVVAFRVWAALRAEGGRVPAARSWLFLALLCLFVCAEEISWGQRIFGWESPAWFLVYNRQKETTLHNLKFGNFNVNKWVFGKFLAVVNVAWALLLPILWRRLPSVRVFVRRLGIPLAQNYHIAVWLAVFVVTRFNLHRVEKADEMMEFMGSVMFLLILTHPLNAEDLPAPRRGVPARPAAP
ncbi:MAG TPA: hypothetical protein VKF62_07200 [Planctomycetota bacterium]|nr:hypothetical protein [Planctomycetota bacterium]